MGRQPSYSKNRMKTILCILIILSVVILVGYFAWLYITQASTPPTETDMLSPPVPEVSNPLLELHQQTYPVGELGPDEEREAYISGEMRLDIPRLDFEGPVLDNVEDATLREGVGLFEQAQLPGPENRNVSIAGHRDIYGMEFYYIDTLTEGDLLYLTYQGKRYIYLYEETFITDPYDWDPIRIKEYSCITLQSCTPINVASDRIFVVGRLIDIEDMA